MTAKGHKEKKVSVESVRTTKLMKSFERQVKEIRIKS